LTELMVQEPGMVITYEGLTDQELTCISNL
jgi:hypothetical protein